METFRAIRRVLWITLGLNLIATAVWYELRAGRRLYSDVLVADALHTRADIFVSLAVAGGLIAVRLGYPLADPILALVVALFIAKIGIDIIRDSAPTLLDRVVLPPKQVEQIARSVPGVLSCHRVRSRGHEQAVFADLHIQVDPAMSAEQGHAIAHQVQRRLHKYRPDIQDVTIHVEPAGSLPGEEGREEIAVQLRRLADRLGLGVHNVWTYEVKGRYYVEGHLELDGTLPLRQIHELASSLEKRARVEIPHLAELTTHIEPLGQLTQALDPGLEETQVAQAVQQVVNEALNAETCHQVQARRGDRGWVVSMHCQLPGEIPLAQAHRTSTWLEARLREKIPGLERVVIHTEPWEQYEPATCPSPLR